VLGLLLLFAALRRCRGRPKPGEEAALPKWMNGIAQFAAAVAIALASLSTSRDIVAVAV
jgi:hypothetical protein